MVPRDPQFGQIAPQERPRSRAAALIAPTFIGLATLLPLATLARPNAIPDHSPQPAAYWARVLHASQTTGGTQVTVTAFSFIGLETGNEALAPGADLGAVTTALVSERRCTGSRCTSRTFRTTQPENLLVQDGARTALRMRVGSCELDLAWSVGDQVEARPPTLNDGLVEPWFADEVYWRARAAGRVCGAPLDTTGAWVG